jgi:ribose 5-phosphate isomerase B
VDTSGRRTIVAVAEAEEQKASSARRVVIGSDIRHPVSEELALHLEERGLSVVRCGAVGAPDTPWPQVAEQVGRLVAQGIAESGIVCCWTGTGVSIAANKVPGVRAALCADAQTARGARRWNDANVLALSLRATSAAVAEEIVDAWFEPTTPDPDEAANISALAEIERRYRERGAPTGSMHADR